MQQNDQGNSPGTASAGSWVDRYMPAPRTEYYGANLIDVSMIRGFLWRQRYILAGVIGLALLLGFIATLLTRPTYEATATVRVDTDRSEIVEGQDLVSPYLQSTEVSRYLETLGEVLESRAMAYLVVDSLKLAANDSFLGLEKSAQPPEGMTAKAWQQERREMAASLVQGNVDVEVPINSRVIAITYKLKDQAIVADVANSIADNFLTDDVRRSIETNSYARKFLETEIAKTRVSLQDAEREAIAYAKANRIVAQQVASSGDSQATGGGGTITSNALADVNQSYTAARTTRIAAEQRWRAVAQIPAAQIPEVQQNPMMQTLATDRARLQGKLSDLKQRYGDSYPEVIEVKAEIAGLDREISRSGAEIKSSLQSAYRVALS